MVVVADFCVKLSHTAVATVWQQLCSYKVFMAVMTFFTLVVMWYYNARRG
jgi:hypothetical protein